MVLSHQFKSVILKTITATNSVPCHQLLLFPTPPVTIWSHPLQPLSPSELVTTPSMHLAGGSLSTNTAPGPEVWRPTGGQTLQPFPPLLTACSGHSTGGSAGSPELTFAL